MRGVSCHGNTLIVRGTTYRTEHGWLSWQHVSCRSNCIDSTRDNMPKKRQE